MRIRRIEVRDFRKLGHLTIEGLSDGLNVLVGDNEAGKSTLLAALRAVLFERHRVGGKVVQAMLPHGQDVRPEISIDFEVEGGSYRLRKAFNQRPEAELSGSALGKVTGDAVEERLAALLGFQAPGSRGSRPDEHQGVHGLLWVDQGLAHAAFSAGAGQETLAAALESEVGQVLGGERGRHLLAAAERRREAFWDRRETPKPKGAFRALADEVSRVEAEVADLQARLRSHDAKVAQLEGKAEALGRHAREARLAGAVRAVDAARAAATRATQIKATADDLARARQRCAMDRDAAAEKVLARRALVAKAEAERVREVLAASEAAEGRVALDLAARDAARDAAAAEAARAARDAAEHRLLEAEQALATAQARSALARIDRALAEAEATAGRRLDAAAAARSITVTKQDLADLDRLGAERDAARARRDAAAVQLAFSPEGAHPVSLDGVTLDLKAPLLLARDGVLHLGGFGRLAIRPGGGVAALGQAVDHAEARLGERLRQCGQESRHAVANLLARRAELDTEAANLERVFAVLAPEGLDALRAEARRLRVLAGTGEEAGPGLPAGEEARAAARRLRAEAVAAERDAGAEANRTNAAREAAARHGAVLGERAAAAARDAAAAASALAAARGLAGDERLEAYVAQATAALAAAAEAERAAQIALEAADPETAALALRRAEGAESAIRADIDTLTRERRDLEIELRTLGQEGLGELLDAATGRLALLKQQAGTTALEAEASLLLHRTLAAAQRESKDRWLGPVRDRVRPYLKLIQPDSEIVLNEKTFSIEHLVRGGVNEPFETLSVGAREQVAVITRLALADILRSSGHPSAIILDDALVNTDEDRLDRMHLVLQKAAETLQVIVLTCRERDFCGLGAPIRRL